MDSRKTASCILKLSSYSRNSDRTIPKIAHSATTGSYFVHKSEDSPVTSCRIQAQGSTE